jgi:hypothetical protein
MYRSSDVSITAVAATNVWKKGGTLCEDSANGFFATPNFAGLGAVVRGTDAESDRQRDGPRTQMVPRRCDQASMYMYQLSKLDVRTVEGR